MREWTAKEREKVRDMFYEGYTDAEIAEALKRTEGAVVRQRCMLKLKKTARPRHTFYIHDAMAEYFPKWYKELLFKRWQERYLM